MKIYEISSQLSFLNELSDREDLTNEQEEKILELWAESEIMFEAKVEAMICINNEIQRDAEILDAEIKRLTDRKRALVNKVDRNKKFLMYEIIKAGYDKIKTKLFNISIKDTSGAIDFEEGFNLESLPSKYLRVKYEVDKKAIKADYENQIPMPDGIVLRRGKSMTVR